MTSAIASGGQCEVPEGVQMLWEAELGAACQNLLAGGAALSWQVFTIARLHEVVISHSCSLALQRAKCFLCVLHLLAWAIHVEAAQVDQFVS